MKEKLIKKLCVKIPIDSEITPYISHKPIAYTLKQFEPKTEVVYKCKKCGRHLPITLYVKTCSGCGYRIDWGVMLECNEFLAKKYIQESQQGQNNIMLFINECNKASEVDKPYKLEEYTNKQQRLFSKWENNLIKYNLEGK